MLKRADAFLGAFVLLFAFWLLYEVSKLPKVGMTERYFSVGTPGPDILPFWLGVCLAVLGAVVLVNGLRRPFEPEESLPDRAGSRRVAYVLVILVLYVVLQTVVGYLLSTILFMATSLVFVDGKRWRTGVAAGTVVAVALYALFQYAFQVPLPTGLLGII